MTVFGHPVHFDSFESPLRHCVGEDSDAVAQNPKDP